VVTTKFHDSTISYMETHSLFARGQIMKLGSQGHIKFKAMWAELAMTLNNIEASIKNVEGWQQTWTNLKRNAKHNKVAYLKALNKTEHGNPGIQLKEEDERICAIYEKHGLGLNIIPELGFNASTNLRKTEEGSYNYYILTFRVITALTAM
ncbi:hypothetical protein TSAR_016539, partial [Trichomalopsis sarcophagae]